MYCGQSESLERGSIFICMLWRRGIRIRIAENLSHRSAPVENLGISICIVQNLRRESDSRAESVLLHFLSAC